MRGGLRLGSLFGIPLYINYTWFFIVGLLTLSYATNLTQENDGWTAFAAAEIGLATSLGLFGSVLVHELAHSLVAKSLGISVKSITLFIFGGMATIEKEADSPWAAFKIAIAGPILSFGLFALLRGVQLTHLFSEESGIGLWLSSVAWANLIIASFNLIPGLPLDGGQILKSLIWAKTGSRQSGLKWAARSGQFLGWGGDRLGIVADLPIRNFHRYVDRSDWPVYPQQCPSVFPVLTTGAGTVFRHTFQSIHGRQNGCQSFAVPETALDRSHTILLHQSLIAAIAIGKVDLFLIGKQ